ncbi:MAG: dihydrodipicolinate synthase family protein [Pseudomonadota bacterium]
MSQAALQATEKNSAKAFGVWSPAVTALDKNLMIDKDRSVAHIRWLLEKGCHGVTFMGTTSEATSFSADERIELLDAVLAAGVLPARLMVGSGCAALTDSVKLAAHATAAGCSVLVLPPFYYKGISDDGLYASYAEIIERVGSADLKLYFYHFPKLSCVPVTHAVIERLLRAYPGAIKGLKDSSGDAEGCAAYIKAFPDLAIFPGSEMLFLDMLRLGGAGTITAGANVNAPMLRQLYKTFESEGDGPAVSAQQEKINGVRMALQARPMIPALKSVISREREDGAWQRVRPPLTGLSDGQSNELAQDLKAAGFVFGEA